MLTRWSGDYRSAVVDAEQALKIAQSNPALRPIEAEVLRAQGSSIINRAT
jgi:hypothetical protein